MRWDTPASRSFNGNMSVSLIVTSSSSSKFQENTLLAGDQVSGVTASHLSCVVGLLKSNMSSSHSKARAHSGVASNHESTRRRDTRKFWRFSFLTLKGDLAGDLKPIGKLDDKASPETQSFEILPFQSIEENDRDSTSTAVLSLGTRRPRLKLLATYEEYC